MLKVVDSSRKSATGSAGAGKQVLDERQVSGASMTGARKVDVIGPTALEDDAAKIHQQFWPNHLGKA